MTNRTIWVGSVELVQLVDAVPAPVTVDWPFPDVPPADWAGCNDGSLDAAGMFHPNLGCFLVRTGERTVLVDCGIGPGPNAYLKQITGALPDRLADAGVSFAAIDAVILTHLHMDHVGWAALPGADGAPRPAMPGIPHYVSAAELAYWSAGPTEAGGHHRLAFDACIRPLIAEGLMQTVAADDLFLPGFALLPLPGHTPGHAAVLVEAGRETVAIIGDTLHCPAQVAHPERCHRADRDKPTARESRRMLLRRVAEGGWLVAGGHLRDDVVFGRIEPVAGGQYRHRPVGRGTSD